MINCSNSAGKSVINLGITSDGILLVGTYSFSVTGPTPSGILPVPKLVPSSSKSVTVDHITSLSLALVGKPFCNLLFASKYCLGGGTNLTRAPSCMYFVSPEVNEPTGCGLPALFIK